MRNTNGLKLLDAIGWGSHNVGTAYEFEAFTCDECGTPVTKHVFVPASDSLCGRCEWESRKGVYIDPPTVYSFKKINNLELRLKKAEAIRERR